MTDPALETLWKRTLDAWDDDEAHGAFLKYCQQTDQLLQAAVRYRGMTGDRDRSALAEKRLKAVALLAMAPLASSRPRAAEPERNTARIVLIVFFVASSLALLYYGLHSP